MRELVVYIYYENSAVVMQSLVDDSQDIITLKGTNVRVGFISKLWHEG
jgi:hypothetical protein